MTRPTIITEDLGGSTLSRAARTGELDGRWYRPRPSDRAAWEAYASDVADSVPSTWASDLYEAIQPTGAAAERLERAAQHGIVVTTGQQPGLFGGPLMVFAKALSARAFADVLEGHVGRPVAAVFWAATDDADFDEAAAVSIADENGAAVLRLERSAPNGTPMSRAPLGPEVDALAKRLREVCGSVADSRPLDAALRAYRRDATVGSAYVTLLRELLAPLGIAVIDASHPAIRSAGRGVLRRALTRADAIASAVRDRNAEIREAGFAPQVEEVAGLSLVFAIDEQGKRRIPLAEANDGRNSRDDLTLSPNVLLRPVLERAILPSAFYVAGPGEIAYFAQVSAVADTLGSPVPVVQPRWSLTIVEPRIQRQLDEFGVDRTLLRDPTALEGLVARQRMPAALAETLERLRDGMQQNVDDVRTASAGLLPEAVIDGVRRTFEHRLDRLERRVLAAVKRREAATMQRIAALRAALYPHGAPQERKLCYIPFLARYGSAFIDDMLVQATLHARSRTAEVPSPQSSSAPPASARA